jgi:cytochrome c peroxidase
VLPVLLLLLVGACAEEDATAPDASSLSPAFGKASALTPIEMLGKSIYFDTNLSLNRNQACATCHDPAADQALGPFLNPVEQALPDNACVVYRVCNGGYPVGMDEVWGPGTCDIAWPNNMDKMCEKEGKTIKLSEADLMKVDAAYDQVGLSIAAFEGSSEVNAYTSKFDAYLAGMVKLTKQERQGLALFNSMKAKCAACHILDAGPNGEPPLFTDFTFDNLGIPINTMNPNAFADPGLGGFLATRPEWAADVTANLGKHKVPTLRNLDKRPYPDS